MLLIIYSITINRKVFFKYLFNKYYSVLGTVLGTGTFPHQTANIICLLTSLWRRQWHPTPGLLPGESHGRRSLVGCSPWGRWGSDTTSLSLSLFTFMHWRRKWQPTPVFLPGESQGWWSLMGCPLWGRTESDTTEAT